MHPRIPEEVLRLWDMWDIRVLVVLSLALQIILSIFGHRRKYIPSLWISIIVWSAYLTADWVATVALGKLSYAQFDNDNDNALRAIWAPLLLLHLGGPDTITAYSLEDNQLWMRHLLEVLVQLSVAIYVILVSWNGSWFSFMSFPALVAGFIKYGERIWVLKSASDDKSGDILPFGNLKTMDRSDYVGVVTFARFFLMHFKKYMEHYDLRYNYLVADGSIANINIFWDALEVQMGLMYDLLYTKAAVNYRKRGFILRCISCACTVTVLVGFVFQLIFLREEEKWHKVDIAITGVLLVGALTLEMYSVVALHLSSDWAMLWLINYDRCEAVIKLRRKIPCLLNKKKNWSNMIGQFDLLSFQLKNATVGQKLSSIILGGLLRIIDCKDVFNRYAHRTFVHDSPPNHLYSSICNYCQHLMSCSNSGGDVNKSSGITEERNLLEIMDLADYDIPRRIVSIHFLTEICYHLENDWDRSVVASGSPVFDEQNRETTRTLSRYMMYLLAMHPSLLSVSRAASDDEMLKTRLVFSTYEGNPQDLRAACERLLNSRWSTFNGVIQYLKGKPKAERWKTLKFMWLRMLCHAASKGQKDAHLQQLRQGGELLTLLWFFLPQCSLLQSPKLSPRTMGEIIERIR